jgi:hypothetical protein
LCAALLACACGVAGAAGCTAGGGSGAAADEVGAGAAYASAGEASAAAGEDAVAADEARAPAAPVDRAARLARAVPELDDDDLGAFEAAFADGDLEARLATLERVARERLERRRAEGRAVPLDAERRLRDAIDESLSPAERAAHDAWRARQAAEFVPTAADLRLDRELRETGRNVALGGVP